MVTIKNKRTILIASGVFIVLVLVIFGIIALVNALGSDEADPYAQEGISNSSANANTEETTKKQDTTKDTSKSESETSDTTADAPLDPATVSTIDIAPLTIVVSYVKGVGAFEYQVARTANGTRYVEFRSAELIGTKCTNDAGAFASILVSPNENESTALSKTVTVDGTKYGLSLEATTCTPDSAKLQAYQKSFSDAFSLLKKMN